jgi:hypothetical protein
MDVFEPLNDVEPSDGNFSVSDLLDLKSRYSLRLSLTKVKRDAPPLTSDEPNPKAMLT